jgi:hypothetical protein
VPSTSPTNSSDGITGGRDAFGLDATVVAREVDHAAVWAYGVFGALHKRSAAPWEILIHRKIDTWLSGRITGLVDDPK